MSVRSLSLHVVYPDSKDTCLIESNHDAFRQTFFVQNDLNHCAYIHSDLQALPFSIALRSTIRREDM
jgi:hypothetical protein